MGKETGNEMEMNRQAFANAVDQLFVVDTTQAELAQKTPEERAILTAQSEEQLRAGESVRKENMEKALAAYKSLSQVKTAQKEASYDKSFPEKAVAKNMSASKRQTRSRMRFSALHEKAEVGNQLMAYENEVEHEKASIVESYKARVRTLDTSRMSPVLMEALAHCTNGMEDDAITSVTAKMQGSRAEQLQAVNECVLRFMKIDTDGIDISSDRAFAQSQSRLEYIARQVDAISELLLVPKKENYYASLNPEARELFSKKMDTCRHLAAYYRAQMEVLTDVTYRMSYNSEISKNYRETDTPEQKTLTGKLSVAAHAYEMVTGKKRLMPFPPNTPEEDSKDDEIRSKIPMSSGEYGKNVSIPKSNPLYYFTENLRKDPEAVQTLQQERYCISGDTITMSESLFRRLDNLAQLKVVQRMDRQELQTMVEQLKKRPADPKDPESVAEARRSNIEGMRAYKHIVEMQIDYLNRKYGLGIMNLSLEEITKHGKDFNDDFANMQGLSSFLDYASTIPELRGADDRNYMNRCCFYMNFLNCESATRAMFMTGEFTQKEYYRDRMAYLAQDRRIMAGMSSLSHTDGSIVWSEASDTEHMDMEDAAKFFEDTSAVYQKLALLQDMNPGETIEWYMLVPNLFSCKSGDEAITILMDQIKDRAREVLLHEYHANGYENPAACVCGIGSDDLSERNEILQGWRKHPEVLRAKGLDDAAIARYEDYMKQWDTVGTEIVFYSTVAELMAPIIMEHSAVKSPKSPEELLQKEFFHAMTSADYAITDELAQYSQDATSRLNIEFDTFLVDHNLFLKEGHKEIFDEKVVPDAAETVKMERELHVGDKIYHTCEHKEFYTWTDIVQICDGKQLKEGVTQEAFEELLHRYNEEFGIVNYLQPAVYEAMNDDMSYLKEEKGEFWRKYVKGRETGWFANGMYMQLMTRIDRCLDLSEQLRKMF